MAKKRVTRTVSTKGKDTDLESIMNFEALIDDNEMERMEAIAQGVTQGRRLTFAQLAHSADFLSNVSIESPELFAVVVEQVTAFQEHARGLLAAADQAVLRLRIADCREAHLSTGAGA